MLQIEDKKEETILHNASTVNISIMKTLTLILLLSY